MKAILPVMFACLIAIGCGGDSVVERPEEDDVAPAEGSAPELTTEADWEVDPEADGEPEVDGKVMPVEPGLEDHTDPAPTPPPPDTPTSNRPPAEPHGSTPPATDDGASADRKPALSNRYTLKTVDGKNLPVVTDSRPDCQIEVLSGHLRFLDANRFSISTATREVCEGRVTAEDVWEASGTVKMTGSALHFEGSSGDSFGSADGVLSGEGVTIESFTHENGVEPVDWKFVKG